MELVALVPIDHTHAYIYICNINENQEHTEDSSFWLSIGNLTPQITLPFLHEPWTIYIYILSNALKWSDHFGNGVQRERKTTKKIKEKDIYKKREQEPHHIEKRNYGGNDIGNS